MLFPIAFRFPKEALPRNLGNLGGHHLGSARDKPTAVRLVSESVDNGTTFFDNCWVVPRLVTAEDWMGAGLKEIYRRP